jgi:asparagine synthase (glutamine-hydrolysing)
MSSQAGIFYFDQRPMHEQMSARLKSALAERDTDARGEYSDAGLFMAHAATWIDEIAAREQQPQTSVLRNTITFDGRLDNREDLLLRLRERLRGQRTDCALALAAYEAWGLDGFGSLVGDWSIAILEPSTHSVILASDFAGVRPLYYYANQERAVWSSYLKPLVAITGAAELDDHFVAGFLTGHGSPARTPYRGILFVPPGHALRINSSGVQSHEFWELPVHDQIRYEDERQYDERLRVLFRESVRARLRTNHPVCSELSGGQDSSSIVCMASHLIASGDAQAPNLTSISFGSPGAADEKFYTAVQRFCGIEGVYVNTDDFPYLSTDHLDQASPAAWGALFEELAQRTKQMDMRVYLTGLGGDLMMGNFVDDSEQLAVPLRQGKLATALREAVGWSKATRVPVHALLLRGSLANLPADWCISSRYEILASSAVRERYGYSLMPRFKAKIGLSNPDWNWSDRWKQAPPERRKHFKALAKNLESGFFRPPEQLQHLYRSHPYIHRPLVEFLLAIPAHVLCRPGEQRRLMRRAFQELLPPEVVKRHCKASFTGTFLDSVRPAAKALLVKSDPLLLAEFGYVNASEVRERLERITQSLSCNEPQLRQIVLLEQWLRSRPEQLRQAAA